MGLRRACGTGRGRAKPRPRCPLSWAMAPRAACLSAMLPSPPRTVNPNAAFREAWHALVGALAASPVPTASDGRPVSSPPPEAGTAAGTLTALADDGELPPSLLAQATPTLVDVYPRFPYLALRAALALVRVDVADEAPWRADAWLCLARIHAYRREGPQALEAVREARVAPASRTRSPRSGLVQADRRPGTGGHRPLRGGRPAPDSGQNGVSPARRYGRTDRGLPGVIPLPCRVGALHARPGLRGGSRPARGRPCLVVRPRRGTTGRSGGQPHALR